MQETCPKLCRDPTRACALSRPLQLVKMGLAACTLYCIFLHLFSRLFRLWASAVHASLPPFKAVFEINKQSLQIEKGWTVDKITVEFPARQCIKMQFGTLFST